MLKKIFIGLGVIFSIILIAIFIMFLSTKSISEYNKTAIPYIKKVIPEISKWDANITKKYMAPKVIKNIKDKDLNRIMSYLSKLGKLKKIDEPKPLGVFTNTKMDGSKRTFIRYLTNAKYEHGDVNITIILLDTNPSFKIYRFDFHSMALLK